MNRHVVERTSEVALAGGQFYGVRHEDPRLGLGLEPRLVGRGTIYIVAGG